MSANKKKLQNFEHDQAEYNRPNQKWHCGHLCDGQSCYLGPSAGGGCQSSCECLPKKVGGRWYCTRSASKGGECADGPGTDGSCACQLPPCQPRLSLRHQRGRLILMAGFACLGVLLFYLGGDQEKREHFISPGELSSAHGSEGTSCAQCHVGGEELGAFTHAGADSSSCLACHEDQIGDWAGRGQLAHGMGKVELKQRTAAAQKQTSDPLLSFASTVFSKHHREGNPLECSLCHQEHQGRNKDLATMTDRQCQVCHQNQFKSFSKGHPSFDQKKYPYSRRTRLVFDHVSHFKKHFKNESQDAPNGYDKANPMGNAATCVACHQPDARGEKMSVANFEISCAKCHTRSVTGGTPLPLFSLPDLGKMAPHPRWPKSGLGLSPATRLLLDPTIHKSLAALPRDPESGDITLSRSLHPELAKEVSTDLSKAYEAIWNDGHSAVTKRLQANGFGRQADDSGDALSKNLVSGLSLDTLRSQLFPGVRWELAEFAFPQLDINTLNTQLSKGSNRSVGLWPSSATGPLTPLMFRLLSQDPGLKKDLAVFNPFMQVGNTSLSDLSKASPREIEAAESIVWGIKRIYQSVQLMGDPILEQFVQLNGGIFDRDTQDFREKIFFAAQSDSVFSAGWKNEFTRFRLGQWPPPSALSKVVEPIKPDGGDDDFGEDDANKEGGADDDFGEEDGGESAPEKESEGYQPATDFFEPTSPLEWMEAGGWFHENAQISYASKGHADPVLKAWLDGSLQALNSPEKETQQIGMDLLFQSLDYRRGVDSGATGKCLKCHTVDQVPSVSSKGQSEGHWRINWYSRGKEYSKLPRLTRFRHDKHLAQMSCLNCHQFNKVGKYLSSFPTKLIPEQQGKQTLEQLWNHISEQQLKKCNPGNFTSNFKPLNHLNDCARCHQPKQAGNSCTQCHSYHALKH